MAIFSKQSPSKFDGGDVSTVVGPEAHFSGTMTPRGSLHVQGEIEGNINEAQEVIVGHGGCVQGDIRAQHVVVGGTVIGDIFASEHLKLKKGGRIVGTIRTKNLLIEEGAIFEGHCDMGCEDETLKGKSDADGAKPIEDEESEKDTKEASNTR